jgi:purine nucleosidase
VALGCVTNIASALLLAPDLVDRIVVIWTSGYPSHAPQVNDSFNLEQDMVASQVLLDSGVPHIYLPGYQVGAQLRLSLPEIERHVRGCGPIGDYLHHLYTHNPLWEMLGQGGVDASAMPGYSWVIWDVINIAWLIEPAWVPSELVRTPWLGDDRRWRADPSRHLMREAWGVQRDAIFGDLFGKLALARPAGQ